MIIPDQKSIELNFIKTLGFNNTEDEINDVVKKKLVINAIDKLMAYISMLKDIEIRVFMADHYKNNWKLYVTHAESVIDKYERGIYS